jgi:hypothetical protein
LGKTPEVGARRYSVVSFQWSVRRRMVVVARLREREDDRIGKTEGSRFEVGGYELKVESKE